MPRNDTINVVAQEWTELTGGDATRASFQNHGAEEVFVKATATSAAPTDLLGSIKLEGGQGETGSLSELWPGVAGTRLWAWSEKAGQVMISHD